MNQIEKLTALGESAFGKSWKASLADALPVARPTITDWTTGKKPIPVGIWANIQKILLERQKEIENGLLLISSKHLIVVEEMQRKHKATTTGAFASYLLSLLDEEIQEIYKAYKIEYARCSKEYPNDSFVDLATIKDALDFNFCIRNLNGNLDLTLAEDCALSFAKNKKQALSFDLDDDFLIHRLNEILEVAQNG